MSENINFFVTLNGVPQIGLTPLPTITVYDSVTSTVVLTGTTVEVGGGFYKYTMPALDPAIDYVIVADAGSTFPNTERYFYGEIESLNSLAADTIWNFPASGSFDAGSFGDLLNSIQTVVNTIESTVNTLSTTSAVSLNLLNILLKYQQNRAKVDPNTKTLTLYDNDGTTPLKVFKLYNNNSVLDINTVFERVPQ
jgi:hypothetical protein